MDTKTTLEAESRNFEAIQSAFGRDAASEKTIDHRYTMSPIKRREISDSVTYRFSENRAIESLGRLTGGRDPFCGAQIYSLNGDGVWSHSDEIVGNWDHLLPSSLFGLTVDGNMCRICDECNGEKKDMNPHVYYAKRIADGAPTLYETVEDFDKFFTVYSLPFKTVYGELFERALLNSRTNPSGEELNLQAADLFRWKHDNGVPVLLAKAVSPSEDIFYGALREQFDRKKEASRRGTVTKLQQLTDSLFEDGKIESFDPRALSLDELKVVTGEFLREFCENGGEPKLAGKFSTHLIVLRAFAKELDSKELGDYLGRLPSYKTFSIYGFLPELSEKDIRDFKKMKTSVRELNVNLDTLNPKIKDFKLSLQRALKDSQVEELKDVSLSYLYDFVVEYINGYAELSTNRQIAAKLCSIYSGVLETSAQSELISYAALGLSWDEITILLKGKGYEV